VFDQRARAEEHLRIIRGLMERATLYRAISAPTALAGGVLSALAVSAIYWNNEVSPIFGHPVRGRQFAAVWIATLVLTVTLNTYFIWREASRGRRPFISSGMKLALRAIAPCLIVPLVFTWWFYLSGYAGGAELQLVVIWVVSYGLALLSTALFAPRSLALLGWAFLVSGVLIVALTSWTDELPFDLPVFAMGLTFGLYHLVYGVCTWPRKGAEQKASLSAP
jgi:hypothetical protein